MKKFLITIFLTAVFFSCEDRLEELNTPRKNASEVPYETLFTAGARSLFDMMVSTNVNENNFRLYSQYWAQTTYPDESQYNMVSRELPDNIFQNAYRDVLKDLQVSKQLLNETWEERGLLEADKATQEAIIEVLEVYTYSVLVDIWGAAPFTEALDEENLNPAYESGADIYNAIIDRLNGAIAKMDVNAAGFPADQDIVYGNPFNDKMGLPATETGDVAQWLKFANTLKVRLAVTISDVDAGKATTMINEALAAGVFESNDDNATIQYLAASPNTNPLWEDLEASGRDDYVMANTIVDKMLALDDPRIEVYADPFGNTYKGGIYGTANTFAQNSRVGELFYQPDLEGVILDYTELNFLLAEAAAKGLAIPGAVEDYYEEGIRSSFDYWGVAGVDAYLAQPEVAYATAAGDWKQKIGIQEWIAYYNRGFEGWNAWRRLDFTGFNVPPGLTANDIPKRLIFPIREATLNGTSLGEAITMIGGTDNVQTRVFWDVQ